MTEPRTYVTLIFPADDDKLDALMVALCDIGGLDPVISHSGITGEARVSVAVPRWETDDMEADQ